MERLAEVPDSASENGPRMRSRVGPSKRSWVVGQAAASSGRGDKRRADAPLRWPVRPPSASAAHPAAARPADSRPSASVGDIQPGRSRDSPVASKNPGKVVSLMALKHGDVLDVLDLAPHVTKSVIPEGRRDDDD